ncbi:MAG: sugar porter family MFS transporter [Planctomycetota bacterium]|nr:MAG: sugar porter family MFS transporter [Planctomycetota bacterium]
MINGVDSGYDGQGQLPERGSIVYAYVLSCVAAVGGLLFGFDIGIINGAIEFISVEFHLDSMMEGFTVGCVMIGCIFGAMFGGFLSDKFGRKKVLIGTAIGYTLSAMCSAIPQTWTQLIIARFVGGLAVGVSSMVSPLYIAEISPARKRGRLVALNQMTIVTGIMLAYLSDWLLLDVGRPECGSQIITSLDASFRSLFGLAGNTNWRWMLGSETIPAVGLLIGLFFVPDSPRWLTKHGKEAGAMRTLARINGREQAGVEMEDIKLTLAMEEEKGSVFQLLKPGLRFALLIGVALAVFQQFSGINNIIFYATKIFKEAGMDKTASIATVIVGFTNCVLTVIALAVIDKLGRKPMLLIGAAGTCIGMILTTLAFQIESLPPIYVLAPVLFYVASFSFGLGPTVWVVMAEIFPTDIRGRAMSIATFSLWFSCYAIAQMFPYLFEIFKEYAFYGFAATCAMMFFFVWFVVIETKGKTLEEIERSWRIKTT